MQGQDNLAPVQPTFLMDYGTNNNCLTSISGSTRENFHLPFKNRTQNFRDFSHLT